jgi:transposase-like protein
MALIELMRKHNLAVDGVFLREAVQLLMPKVIELEANQQIGAKRYDCTGTRETHRNGFHQ